MSCSFRVLRRSLVAVTLVSALVCRVQAQHCDPGQALRFDGVEDFAWTKSDADIPVTEFTLTAWIRTAAVVGNYGTVVSYGEDPVTDHHPWALVVLPDGTVNLTIEDSLDNNYFYSSLTTVLDDRWHHVAASRWQDGTVAIYVDGVKETKVGSTPEPQPSAAPVAIGNLVLNGSPDLYSLWFFGDMEEVSVWNVALDEPEIQALMTGIVDPSQPEVSLYYEMDDTTSQFVRDFSSFDHVAVLGVDEATAVADPAVIVSTAPLCCAPDGFCFNLELNDATAGDQVSLQSWGAVPGSLMMLVAVDVSGTPLFFNLGIGGTDGRGERLVQFVVIPGLGGLDITLLSLGFRASDHHLALTNSEVLSLH